ncbi:phytoene/squalene synthase family protein [Gordonia shandongensis]|uniref:phytoene/squalene synthase family protein n=1 Tax=Gordonia shandongensis TaxID=376351 RepID=UPI0003FB5EEC|nr:phytoene/squalene synthase family protein [Gordonia shandongensis]
MASRTRVAPAADRGYRVAARIAARSGRTYHLASRLLRHDARRAVHALYAYARIADDIVDGGLPATVAITALDDLDDARCDALASRGRGRVEPEVADVLAALADAVRRFGIDASTFDAFGRSMRMDLPGHPLHRSRFATLDELAEYTYGSAAVIGLQLLPVLGADPADRRTAAGAALLGEAFQLTNFLRDVAEDLARDRIYLPADQLAAFDVDETVLRGCAAAGRATPGVRRAVAHLIAVNRDQYRRAVPAADRLPGVSRPAIRAAAVSYARILDEIERRDCDVFAGRAVVPTSRRVVDATLACLRRPAPR